MLLRDAQVLPIWEGTTNVLALDVLRVASSANGVEAFRREIGFILQGLRATELVKISARIEQTVEQADAWLKDNDEARLEAGARRFALTLGRVLSVALLVRHAQWSLEHEHDRRALAAARRYALHGFNLLAETELEEARMLARDEP